jgi:hypothetical protein
MSIGAAQIGSTMSSAKKDEIDRARPQDATPEVHAEKLPSKSTDGCAFSTILQGEEASPYREERL